MRRYLLATAACFALSGCGASGGGATPQAPASTAQQTQRSVAGQSLSEVQAVGLVLNYGETTTGSTAFAYRRHLIATAARTVAATYRSNALSTASKAAPSSVVYSACNNGVESATTVLSSTEEQLYIKLFYDASCANLYETSYFDIVATSSTSGTASGNLTEYTTSGAVASYQTLVLALTGLGTNNEDISILTTDAASQTASPLGTVGVACSITSSSSTLGCGYGVVAHSASLGRDQGDTIAMSVSETTTNNTVTVPIAASASAYTGTLNALSLAAGTFPDWTISGGSLVDTASLSGSITYSTIGLPLSGSLTIVDAADNATAVLAFNGTQIGGVITQTSTSTTLATFTVDEYGNGTIAYANGTTGTISQWQIVS